jgi:hypothetical protein
MATMASARLIRFIGFGHPPAMGVKLTLSQLIVKGGREGLGQTSGNVAGTSSDHVPASHGLRGRTRA